MIQASLQLRLVSVVSLAGRKLERAHEFVRMFADCSNLQAAIHDSLGV